MTLLACTSLSDLSISEVYNEQQRALINVLQSSPSNVTVAANICANATDDYYDWSTFHGTLDPFRHISSAYNYSIPNVSEMSNATSAKKRRSRKQTRIRDIDPTFHCNFSGRIFAIGAPKTGTSSVSLLLQVLGYECMNATCEHQVLRNIYYKSLRSMREWLLWSAMPFYVDDISFALINHQYYKRLYKWTQISQIFADQPWSFLYPLFDEWYPSNTGQAKFIYTMRRSTYNRVNSLLKHALIIEFRRLRRSRQLNTTQEMEFLKENPISWNSPMENKLIKHKWLVEWIMYNARLYEKHHENVMQYFGPNRIGVDKDVLVLCLECETPQALWCKISKFLQCNKTPNISFPHELQSVQNEVITQHDYLPRNFSLDWRHYNFSTDLQRLFDSFYDKRYSAAQRMHRFATDFLNFNIENQSSIQEK